MILREFLNFNSIKVRLKREYGPVTFRPHYQFQFHKGTIKTNSAAFVRMRQHDFNSIKVRLKPKIYQDFYRNPYISIP